MDLARHIHVVKLASNWRSVGIHVAWAEKPKPQVYDKSCCFEFQGDNEGRFRSGWICLSAFRWH